MTVLDIYTKKEKSCIFLPVLKKNHQFYFATAGTNLPGLRFTATTDSSINQQINTLYLSNLKTPKPNSFCKLEQNFCETFYLEKTQEKLHLYFGLITEYCDFCDNITITSFPSLLAAMPKNKTRIAYLKILQVLCGADKEKLEAIEFKRK